MNASRRERAANPRNKRHERKRLEALARLVAAAVFAWGLSAAISIWTLPVAVAATTFGVPVRRLYTASTARFAVLMIAVGVLYFALLNAWLGGRD